MINEGLGVELENLRMIQNNTGGTFGYKFCPTMEALLGAAHMATGRMVYLKYDYWMSIAYTGKRSPHYYHCKLAADENGKFLAMENHWICDHGPYMEFGDNLTQKGMFCGGGYDIPNMRGEGKLVRTNHSWGAPFRAWGSPQAFFAGESVVDELAKKMGVDPFELRYKNLAEPGATYSWGQAVRGLLLQEALRHGQALLREGQEAHGRGVDGRGQEGRRHLPRHLRRRRRRRGRRQRRCRAAPRRRRAHLQHLGGPRPGLRCRHARYRARGVAPARPHDGRRSAST